MSNRGFDFLNHPMVVLDVFKSPNGGLEFHTIGVLDFLFRLNRGLGNTQKGF